MKYVRCVLLCFLFILFGFWLNVNAEEIKAIECPSEYDVNKDLYSLITSSDYKYNKSDKSYIFTKDGKTTFMMGKKLEDSEYKYNYYNFLTVEDDLNNSDCTSKKIAIQTWLYLSLGNSSAFLEDVDDSISDVEVYSKLFTGSKKQEIAEIIAYINKIVDYSYGVIGKNNLDNQIYVNLNYQKENGAGLCTKYIGNLKESDLPKNAEIEYEAGFKQVCFYGGGGYYTYPFDIKTNSIDFSQNYDTDFVSDYIVVSESELKHVSYFMEHYKKDENDFYIHNQDANTKANIENTSFGIYRDNKCSKRVFDEDGNETTDKKTDKYGLLKWEKLSFIQPYTMYYIKENSMGYKVDGSKLKIKSTDNNCYPVRICHQLRPNSGNVEKTKNKNKLGNLIELKTLSCSNDSYSAPYIDIYSKPFGNITVLKQDEKTGNVIKNVEFTLFGEDGKSEVVDVNNNKVKSVRTDDNGVAEFKNIPYGKYVVKETKSTDWYKSEDVTYEVTLDKEHDALRFTENDKISEIANDRLTYRLGDVESDGIISYNDYYKVEYIINKEMEPSSLEFYAADVNKDGNVDEKDLELFGKYLKGDKSVMPDALKEFELPGQAINQRRVSLSVTNKPIELKISKRNKADDKDVEGAKIVIKNSKDEEFLSFKSLDEVKVIPIPIGDYTIEEVSAPSGYKKINSKIKFRVLKNGSINIINEDKNMYEIEKIDGESNYLKIYNSYLNIKVPNTGSVVAISTLLIGFCLIGFGVYFMYNRYKK